MTLDALAQAGGRVAVVSDKAAQELQTSLMKWFAKHFVRGASLATLRGIHSTDAMPAFLALISECPESDVIRLLSKLDPHRPELVALSREAMVDHIKRIASCELDPAPRPARQRQPKASANRADAAGKARHQGGVAERSRY